MFSTRTKRYLWGTRKTWWKRSSSQASLRSRRHHFLETLEPRLVLSGTPELIDLNSSGASEPSAFVEANGFAYFTADDGVHGRELWRTDGTAAGTAMVTDLYTGSAWDDGSYSYVPNASNPQNLTVVGGSLFFTADDGVNGTELWKSDGTASGTALVKDIQTGSDFDYDSYSYVPNSSNPQSLTAGEGLLYFTADDGVSGTELWQSDGTTSGTVLVKDVYSGSSFDNDSYSYVPNSSNPENLTAVEGLLFFTANDGVNGTELWETDGTAAGTVLVKDIQTGSDFDSDSSSYVPNSSNPQHLTTVDGTLFFAADDGVNGNELWKSDGTATGTVLVSDIYSGSSLDYDTYSYAPHSSNPQEFTEVGGLLFFVADDGVHGGELWKSDGTSGGTGLVKDIESGSSGDLSYYPGFTTIDETLFFAANDGVHGKELWRSDGTEAGTVLVKDIHTGSDTYGDPNNSYPFYMQAVNGTLYFSAYTDTAGRELWQSDGTMAGTVQIADVG